MREKTGFRENMEAISRVLPNKEMLTTSEVATFLNCDKRTVRNLIESNKLPAVDIGVGAYVIYRVATRDLANFCTK